MAASFSEFKAISIIGMFETLGFLAFCGFIYHFLLGKRIDQISFPIIIIPISALALSYATQRLLGFPHRTQHYEKIFDAWNEKKHMQWKIYVILVAVLIFISVLIVGKSALTNRSVSTSADAPTTGISSFK